jgi:hypothetical protein
MGKQVDETLDTLDGLLQHEFAKRLLVHTCQAIGGALTVTSVDAPALAQGRLDIDNFAQLAAGVLVQTGVVAFATWRARRKAKKIAKRIDKAEENQK